MPTTTPVLSVPSRNPFERIHRRFDARPIDLDLAAAGAELDPAARARAHRLWVARMRDEQRAVVALTELMGDLARLGAPVDLIGAGARVIHDETRHVQICASLASALDPTRPLPAALPELPARSSAPAEVRAAKAVVSLLCVGETLSMFMLRAARDDSPDPVIAAVLEHLLTDESLHSRFGWWWLELAAPRLREETAREVRAMLPGLFGKLDAGLGHAAPRTPLTAGAPSSEHRADAFVRAMTETIVPRLEAAGLGASAPWSAWNGREAA
jgi:hypothetical protein